MGILCDHGDRLLKLHCNAVLDGNELIVCWKVGGFGIVNDLVGILPGFVFAGGIFECITFLEYCLLS